MNIIKKFAVSTLLALSMLPASAIACVGAECDILYYCTRCHDGLTVNGVNIGGGAKSCPQRTVIEWEDTISKMNPHGCAVPSNLIPVLANYLASLTPPTTTSTTTTTKTLYCYSPSADGLSYITEASYVGYCSSGWAYTPPPPCPDGVLSIVLNHQWQCTNNTTTSTTTSTTVSSTTSTSLCNTYVNGTTQYPYSGKGACHSYSNDSMTGTHIVREAKYCQKHMTHFNSTGNHVHAYPHPACVDRF